MTHYPHIPLRRAKPDAERFVGILCGTASSTPVPLIEHIIDDVVLRPVVEHVLERSWSPAGLSRASQRAYLDNVIAFWHQMGYDSVRFEESLPFRERQTVIADAAPGSDKERASPCWAGWTSTFFQARHRKKCVRGCANSSLRAGRQPVMPSVPATLSPVTSPSTTTWQ
jgi:hypothetical protein